MVKRCLSIAFVGAYLVALTACSSAPADTFASCERAQDGRVVAIAGALVVSLLSGADMRGAVPMAQDCHKLKR